ncbi:DUF305 domain-containing protein [Phytoactinopolyspora endophytica]|uniref:DUF305 domain-containing protein n=1 Tax=Phytoactinopolyspora endophytica TaxID=1642495 RepID=UPI00101D1366|nr:DUF305 domain-containing protein [Phytoactinopolyspora endophytica]
MRIPRRPPRGHHQIRARPEDPADADPAEEEGGPTDTGDDTGEQIPDLSDADIEFLQYQVAYSDQTVELMELIPDRTDRDELFQYRDQVVGYAEEFSDMAREILADHGAEPDPDQVAGLTDPEEVAALEDLSDLEFDLAFVDVMRGHVVAEADVAEEALADGLTGDVRAVAEEVITHADRDVGILDGWAASWPVG